MFDNIVISSLARMTRKKPEEIQGYLSLGTLGLSHSFGLSALRSQIERQLNTPIPTIDPNMKVDDLVRLVSERINATGSPETKLAPAVEVSISPSCQRNLALGLSGFENLGLGIDMQEIAQLPVTSDYRADDFYATHFTATEIAGAVLKADPRAHLCGIFCAKEAAKKSHVVLLPLRMLDFNVNHDSAGRPLLSLTETMDDHDRFRFLISITHTAQFAAATCLTSWK